MSKPELPIDLMDEREFATFKKSFLDTGRLNDEGLNLIKVNFGIKDSPNSVYYVNCDEQHQHHYECLRFKHPIAGMVERLVNEVQWYRQRMAEIAEKAKTH